VIGALVLVGLPEALRLIDMPVDIADKSRLVIYGAMLILILLVRPEGILPERQKRSVTTRSAEGDRIDAPSVLASAEAPHSTPDSTPVLKGQGLRKSFGGINAVADFDIVLSRGRITGADRPQRRGQDDGLQPADRLLKADSGEVTYKGKSIAGLNPHQIVRAGIARSFQDLRLFTRMTVLENVVVALPRQSGDNIFRTYFSPGLVRREEHENAERGMEVLRFVGLEDKADERAENLSYAEEKLLVVARLLATGATCCCSTSRCPASTAMRWRRSSRSSAAWRKGARRSASSSTISTSSSRCATPSISSTRAAPWRWARRTS
jgi:branched-chain amino acid transport system permease protein